MIRVATLNLWMRNWDWPARRRVLRDGFAALAPDVVGLQEVDTAGGADSAAEILGAQYEIRHQQSGLLGDGNGAAIASRWPIAGWHEVDLQLTSRTADFPATTLIAELDGPEPLLFVNHLPSWKPQLELERELQTAAAVRRAGWRSSWPGGTSCWPATSTRRPRRRASASCAGCSRSTGRACTTTTPGRRRTPAIRATPSRRPTR